MSDSDILSASSRLLSAHWNNAASIATQGVRRASHQATAVIGRAHDKIVRLEEAFAGKSPAEKIGLGFLVAAAATVTPGGYIALGIWGIARLRRGRQAKAALPDQTPGGV